MSKPTDQEILDAVGLSPSLTGEVCARLSERQFTVNTTNLRYWLLRLETEGKVERVPSSHVTQLSWRLAGQEHLAGPSKEERMAAYRQFEAETCRELIKKIRYEDGTLYWVASLNPRWTGKMVGGPDPRGYWQVCARPFGKVLIHRLIFFMHHGYLPNVVDHIDGNRGNNRIENLRAATVRQNTCNSRAPAKSKTGHKGVRQQGNKWAAEIGYHGKTIRLGSFDNIQDAIAARKAGEEKYHGEFAPK